MSARDVQAGIDQALREKGLPPMHRWSNDEWLRYLDGWAQARCQTPVPAERDQDTPYRRVGQFLAVFEDPHG